MRFALLLAALGVSGCAVVDAFGGDDGDEDDDVIIDGGGDGDGDGDGDPDEFRGCVFREFLGQTDSMSQLSTMFSTCAPPFDDTRLDIEQRCGLSNGGAAAIFEAFIAEAGVYAVCVSDNSTGGAWLASTDSCSEDLEIVGVCSSADGCVELNLNEGDPLIVYYDPGKPGSCSALIVVDIFFTASPG